MKISVKDLSFIAIEGIDMTDYPDLCDAFIASAQWKATGTPLTESELMRIDQADAHNLILTGIMSSEPLLGDQFKYEEVRVVDA